LRRSRRCDYQGMSGFGGEAFCGAEFREQTVSGSGGCAFDDGASGEAVGSIAMIHRFHLYTLET
jgi:hypothetical protein